MNGCKITIGVPVYNGQETIKKCISSLQSQTYRNIEIIIVNDGSTDDTYNICSELAKNDNRISVVSIHNSGVSNARNCIIEKATGDYLCFVDADDFLMPYHIEGLASCIQDKNTLLATTYQIQNRGGVIEERTFDLSKSNKKLFNPEEAETEMFYGYTLGNYCWDKLYNTEFIRANGLVFDINLKIGEDGDFVNQYVRKCNKVILIDNRSYIHVINKNSVMENLFYGDAYLALFDAIKLSARYLSTSNSSDVKKAIIASMVQGQEHLLRIMCARGINNDIYQEELRLFKKRYMRVVFNTRVKLKQRLKIFIMGCNPFRRYTYYKMYQNMLQDR